MVSERVDPQPISINVNERITVSGIALIPAAAHCCLILAHGAGAGMHHPFMSALANGLSQQGIATLRYQFPFMENRSRRPDSPAVARSTVRAAVRVAHELMPTLPLLAGGKSFGGRMTSQAQAERPLPHVQALCLFGFPLHPSKKPSMDRAEHLIQITIPMLFLQGTRDALADLSLIESVVKALTAPVTLKILEGADHGFSVQHRGGRTDAVVLHELLEAVRDWCAGLHVRR